MDVVTGHVVTTSSNSSSLNFSSTAKPPPEAQHATIIDIFMNAMLAFIGVIGLIGNLVIITVIVKRQKVQTPTNVFVLNMAVCAVAIASIIIPTFLFLPHISWPFGILGCKYFVMPIMEHFAGVCVLTHTALSFARYAVLACKTELSNPWFLRRIIGGIWIISLMVLSVPLMGILGEFYFLYSPNGRLICQLGYKSEEKQKAYRVCVFFVVYLVPMVTTGYSYLRINRIVVNNMRRVKDSLSNDTAVIRRRKTRKLNRMLTLMYVIFGMTTLPIHVLLFIVDFHLVPTTFKGGKLLFTVFLLMFYSQIVVNPAVLLYMGDEYRKGLAEINENMRKISAYSAKRIAAYNCAFSHGMEKLNQRRGNMSTTSYTIVTEISHLGDSRVDIRNSVVSRRKRSSNASASARRCSKKSSGGTRREKRISSTSRNPYRKKTSNDSLAMGQEGGSRRHLKSKKLSSNSTDSFPFDHCNNLSIRKPSYEKMSSNSSLEEVFITNKGNVAEQRSSQIPTVSVSSLEDDGHPMSFRRFSYRKINSCNSLDEDGYLSSSPHLATDSSSSLEEVWTDSYHIKSRVRKNGVAQEYVNNPVTVQRCRLSDVEEDLHSDVRQSDVECMKRISEIVTSDDSEMLLVNDGGLKSRLAENEKKNSNSRTISFYADGMRVLIPVGELENILCYQVDEIDDTYLHLPDQSEDDGEGEAGYNKETVM